MTNRKGTIDRKTKETQIRVVVDLDGSGAAEVKTGIPFFDHMLETLAKHGALDLTLTCDGDLHIDQHHTVEDSGIALGQAIDQALGDRKGVARAGCFYFPLDEALARSVVDLSGRSWLDFNVELDQGPRSAMDISVIEGFFKAIADNARCNLHIDLLRGRDFHHATEAMFKSFARALRQAVARDERVTGVPSTKGVL
jgi:imidazoleglycerol-phosphate dehydratase